MKKMMLLIIPGCFSILSFAQESGAYLKAGLNLANVSTTSNGEVNDANMLTSFHVGIMGDLAIGKYFAIQPALYFTSKGSKLESGNPSGATYYKATTNPYYIELPVNAVFKLPLIENRSAFFFGAGPYLAIGIAGKRKIEGQFLGAKFYSKENIVYSNDDPSTFDYEEGSGLGVMKRFDYGLNATAGFQLNKGIIGLQYGYGLAKLQSGTENEDDYNKHRVLALTVGFKL